MATQEEYSQKRKLARGLTGKGGLKDIRHGSCLWKEGKRKIMVSHGAVKPSVTSP